jgi:hypothetical protein
LIKKIKTEIMMAKNKNRSEILDIVPNDSDIKSIKPESEFKRKTRIFFSRILLWVILVLSGLLVGAAVVFFAVHLPVYNELKNLKAEHTALTEENTQVQESLAQSQADYETCSAELLATQNMLSQTASTKYAALMLYQASAARTALEEGNTSTAASNISNTESYLANLKPLVEDQTALRSIETALSGAKSKLAISPSAAVEDLTTLVNSLYDLLLRLGNNP